MHSHSIPHSRTIYAQQLGGTVARGGSGEYGRTVMRIDPCGASAGAGGGGLLAGLPAKQAGWRDSTRPGPNYGPVPEGCVGGGTIELTTRR